MLEIRGRLHEAAERLRMALRWAGEHSGRRNHISALVLSGLGEVLREQGDLAEAERTIAYMSRLQVGLGAQLALSACAVQWHLAQGGAPEAREALSRQAATARAGGHMANWLAATVATATHPGFSGYLRAAPDRGATPGRS